MPSKVYPKALELLAAGTLVWTSDTIQVMLVNASATYNEVHDFVDDIAASEISGGSYARQTLTSKTATVDTGNDRIVFDAADPVFTAVASGQTVGAAIVFKGGANDAARALIAFIDGTDLPTNGSDVSVVLPSTGVFYVTY